jgi:sec-independent protein translocase protein TatB
VFGINGGEAIIILVIAVLVIGPERLPKYAEQLAGLVKRARVLMADAKEKVSEELGPEITDVDWAQLDPRRYDPRRIVRDALLDDTPVAPSKPSKPARPSGSPAAPSASKAAETAVGAATAAAAATGAAVSRDASEPSPQAGAARWPEPQPALQAGEAAPFDTEAT